MDDKVSSLINKKFKTQKRSKLIIISTIIIIGLVYLTYHFFWAKSDASTDLNATSYTVEKRDMEVILSGSNSLVASEISEIISKVSSKVENILFQEGDSVKKGDLIMTLDSSDFSLNIEQQKTSLEQARINVQDSYENFNNLNITAPFNGIVTQIQVQPGDLVNSSSTFFTITDTSELNLIVPFTPSISNSLNIGDTATLFIQDLTQEVPAKVSYIGNNTFLDSNGGSAINVEFIVTNPGALSEGMLATAEINSNGNIFTSTQSNVLKYINKSIEKASYSATVKEIYVKESDFISKGATILTLESDQIENIYSLAELKYNDTLLSLQSSKESLDDYNIYAEIDGVIAKTDVKINDKVSSGQLLTTIIATELMELELQIDELDISKIKKSQPVRIDIDALPQTLDKPLTGEVANIGILGNSSNGVTTYPVLIVLKSIPEIKSGMNANAEIIIEQKNNALSLPVETIKEINNRKFVYVKSIGESDEPSQSIREDINLDSSNKENPTENTQKQQRNPQRSEGINPNFQGSGQRQENLNSGQRENFRKNIQNTQIPDGFILRPVTTGINDNSYIEILSGLNEGDEVFIPKTNTENTSTPSNSSPFGGSSGRTGPGGMSRGF